MQPVLIRSRRRSALRLALTLLAPACSVTSALADDPNPYYVGVSTGVTHDNNVFRPPPPTAGVPTQPIEGDTYYSVGLLGGIDQPFGRQHLVVDANVKFNHFSHLRDLDNTSYGLSGKLDWEALDRLSGTLSLSLNQNLSSYSLTTTTFTTEKNLQTTGQFVARAQYGLAALWSLEGQYTHQLTHYSADAYQPYNTNQDALRVGAKYRPSGLLTLGMYVQGAYGRYPDANGLGGDRPSYERNDLVLTGTWSATGQSLLDGRVSVGRQHFSHSNSSGLSGATGALTWTYRPTGKLTFMTTVSRDTGFETGFINPYVPGNPSDTSLLTTAVSLGATYAATAKISINGGARYNHRSLSNSLESDSGTVPFGQGSDNVQSQYLGITYSPLRSLQMSCNLTHDSRSVTSGTPLFLSYPYSGNTVGCSAQFVLQ